MRERETDRDRERERECARARARERERGREGGRERAIKRQREIPSRATPTILNNHGLPEVPQTLHQK